MSIGKIKNLDNKKILDYIIHLDIKIQITKKMKNEDIINIGKRIKNLWEALGLNQQDFAKAIGVTPSFISQIVHGHKDNPGVGVFIKMARKFNVSLDYLLYGIGDMFHKKPDKNNVTDKIPANVETIDDLFWLMEHSVFYKNIIMGFAYKMYYENENIIKHSLKKNSDE